jgi:membrane associated rhomboid family serine protease
LRATVEVTEALTHVIIPVGINHVIRGLPWVTISIIAICTLVQIYTVEIAPSPEQVIALIDTRVKEVAEHPDDGEREAQAEHEIEALANRIPTVRFGYHTGTGLDWRLLSAAFIHAGWLHLIGNMLFLWLTGAALEDRWGRARFAAFFMAGAVASGLFFNWTYHGAGTTLVGASGAISAVMGAFLVFFARTQIHFVYWWFRGFGRFDAAAYVALPLWFGEQLLESWAQTSPSGESSVAFTAHIGGFLTGLAVALCASMVAKRKTLPEAVARPRAQTSPPPVVAPRPSEAPKRDPAPDPEGGPRFLS